MRAFPDRSGKFPISGSASASAVWARNGRELFFTNVDNQVMVAAYTVQGDSFVAEKPRVWSEKRLANFASTRSYDLAPDGKRIVALMPAEAPEGQNAQHHVIFLLNFFDELRRRTQGVPPAGGK